MEGILNKRIYFVLNKNLFYLLDYDKQLMLRVDEYNVQLNEYEIKVLEQY
jgi:hypothetical protein